MLQIAASFVLYVQKGQNTKKRAEPRMRSEELNNEFIAIKDAAYRYAVSLLHDPTLAEDATQDLYEKLWRRRLLIRPSTFRQLAMVTIRNICLDVIREQERRRCTEPTLSIEAESNEDRELTQMVGKIISTLPEREREVIHLHDCEGLAYDEIAQIIGSTESAARMACSRARQKVREELLKVMNYGV